MAFNPNKIHQKFNLKDGRQIFTTHNGFRHFVVSKKGETTKVTESYYQSQLKHILWTKKQI